MTNSLHHGRVSFLILEMGTAIPISEKTGKATP